MEEIIRFAILGLGAGAIYALAAQGIVLIYRGSGIINFSHGAMALLGGSLFIELNQQVGLSGWVAGLLAVGLVAVVGFLVDFGVLRRIRSASPLARLVVTLAVLAILESIVILRYGSGLRFVEQFLPSDNLRIWGSVVVSADRLWLCLIAVLVTAALWAFYRFTEFGRQTTAVAENPRSAATMGISPDAVSQVNWIMGSALAALSGILLIPLTGLMPAVLVLLIIPMLAAALVGRFSSFPLTLLGGLVIGIAQSLIGLADLGTGWAETVPFLVIIAVLALRGHALPLRGFFADRLPAVGAARRPGWGSALAVAAAVIAIYSLPVDFVNAAVATLIGATVVLSIVVLTGLAGQISLGQYAFAGIGAFAAARLADIYGMPFPLALLVGIAVTVPVGLLFALPALRTRGVNLAIVTMGLGVAVDSLIFKNKDLTGGFRGTIVEPPSFFGISIDSIMHPQRYALVALALFAICAWLVANIRRGASGRKMLATRSNERAAASLGVSVMGAKLYAFAVAAGIAAAAGVVKAFRFPNVRFDAGYAMFDSVPALLMAFMGGIGFISGAVIGGLMSLGGVVDQLIASLIALNEWEGLVVGVATIFVVIAHPDGIAEALQSVVRRFRKPPSEPRPSPAPSAVSSQAASERVAPEPLEVDNVTVRFGGVTALQNVSFQVAPGEVVGLIGPNGAGKTTLIDTVTGFTQPASGRVRLAGKDLAGVSPAARAGRGLRRTFQSLELFDDLTVADNVRVGCDNASWKTYFSDMVRPHSPPLPGPALHMLEAFGLAGVLGRLPGELSFGQRRLLGLARAAAALPSVLLLDEPAAGLGPDETRELGRLVRWLAEEWGMAVLLVEHDMSLVMRVSDRLVVLDFGRKLAEGQPGDVSRDPQVVKAYLGSDSDAMEEAGS